MSKKSLGYVELEWNCPNCNGRNSGQNKVCANCGAPQPEDVQFQQAAEEKIIEDAQVIERAKIGPDIHCAFCGTRNPADATTCSRCGADLSEGTSRSKGAVLGSHKDKPAPDVECSYCGTMNPATAHQCAKCGASLQTPVKEPAPQSRVPARGVNKWLIIGLVAILAVICISAILFFTRTEDVVGRVNNVAWERQITILGLAPSRYQGWRDEIPIGAEVGSCREERRSVSPVQVPNSVEVCGTPYTVDTGSGLGEVMQDCEYQVYDDLCNYTVIELQPVDQAVLSGSDLNPRWPAVNLAAEQQEGDRQESYRIIFSVDGEQFTYTTSDPREFEAFVPGSSWQLSVNPLGGVVGVEPAR